MLEERPWRSPGGPGEKVAHLPYRQFKMEVLHNAITPWPRATCTRHDAQAKTWRSPGKALQAAAAPGDGGKPRPSPGKEPPQAPGDGWDGAAHLAREAATSAEAEARRPGAATRRGGKAAAAARGGEACAPGRSPAAPGHGGGGSGAVRPASTAGPGRTWSAPGSLPHVAAAPAGRARVSSAPGVARSEAAAGQGAWRGRGGWAQEPQGTGRGLQRGRQSAAPPKAVAWAGRSQGSVFFVGAGASKANLKEASPIRLVKSDVLHTPTWTHDINVSDKRLNALAAVEQDREVARREIAEIERTSETRKREQDQAIYDRMLERLFHPVPTPKKFLVPPCKDEDLLATPQKEPWVKPGRSIFTPVEKSEIMKVCLRFTSLIRPYAPLGEEPGPPIMTRPAMCCLLMALKAFGGWEGLQYHQTLDGFDSVCGLHTARGCSMAGGAVRGLLFEEQRGEVVVAVTDLFDTMLQDGRHEDELQDAKRAFFDEHLPGARSFADRRLRQLARWLTAGKAVAEKRDDVIGQLRDLKNLEVALDIEKQEKHSKARRGSGVSMVSSLMSVPHEEDFGGEWWDTASSARASHTQELMDHVMSLSGPLKPRIRTRSLLKELDEIKVVESGAVRRVPAERRPTNESVAHAGSADGPDGLAPAQLNEQDKLYAHTFAVSKCEFLSMTLLEPEVMHDVWMFWGVFRRLFECYCDVKTGVLRRSRGAKANGHMTRSAFVLFCVDFGLFPHIVDYNTLQSIYQCAQSTVPLTPDEVARFLASDVECAFKVGDIVEVRSTTKVLQKGLEVPISKACPGELYGRIIDVDNHSEPPSCNVMFSQRRKLWINMADMRQSKTDLADHPQLAANGCYVNASLSWLNQDFSDMTDEQLESVTILSSIEEWMSSNRMRSKDVFRRLDTGLNGSIDVDEMMEGISRMFFEVPPTREQVANALRLVDSDGNGVVEYVEFDAVLVIVRERKVQQRQGSNFYMKKKADMSPAELAAEHFFVPMTRAMDTLGWNPAAFFKQFDKDGSGQLGVDELFQAAQTLGITLPERNVFKKGLMLVDPNFDGTIGLKELKRTLVLVRQALRKQAKETVESENPFVSNRTLGAPEREEEKGKTTTIFGLKAFVECLLKIGVGYLSFHGSAEQSQLPTHSKVIWLLGYLGSKLESHKTGTAAPRSRWAQTNPHSVKKQDSLFERTASGRPPLGPKDPASYELARRPMGINSDRWCKVQRRNYRSLSILMNEAGPSLQAAMKDAVRRNENLNRGEDPDDAGDDSDSSSESSSAEQSEPRSPLASPGGSPSQAGSGRREGVNALDRLRRVIKDDKFAWALPPIKRVMLKAPRLFDSEPAAPPTLAGKSFARRSICAKCGAVPYKGWGKASCQACGLGEVILLECMSTLDPDELDELPALDRLLPTSA